MKSIESIRAERLALSVRRNEIIEAAVAKSQGLRITKGTDAYLVSTRYGSPAVVALAVKVESLGKRKGTATRADGSFLKVQLWAQSSILFTDRADVEAFAAEAGPVAYREHLLGSAYCVACNLPNLRSDLVAKNEAEVEALIASADTHVVGTVEWR
jgi:hypothetical protein